MASELIVALIKYNLEMNPAVSGRPARLNEQRTKQKKVMGIALPRPDKLFIVTLFWIKKPRDVIAMNKPPLIMAWLNICINPAATLAFVPIAKARVIYPICATEEWASSLLISFSYIAIIVPANLAMIERGSITYNKVLFIKSSEFSKTENNMRANMYKEAFVAVAASKTETADGA